MYYNDKNMTIDYQTRDHNPNIHLILGYWQFPHWRNQGNKMEH